jgi:hypothetical protein
MLRDRFAIPSIVAGVFLCALASGCSGKDQAAAPTTQSPSTVPPTGATGHGPTPTPAKSPTGSPPPVKIPRTFDPKNFSASPTDVNRWAPMTPGVQSVMKGYVNVGGRRLPHIRVVTVIDATKKVNGVHAVLVLDQDFDGGQLSEQAVDYFAEDVGGNVWYLGSYTEAYEGGQFLNAEDAWLTGVNGAIAGLFLPADPKTGSPPFYQTQIPGGEQSTAQVVAVGGKKCVPFKCYTGVVVVQEQGSENKYWAPGVGMITTEPLSGTAQETEDLVNITQLSAKGLAELRAEALRLDRNAAVVVPSVFGGSEAAARTH